MVFFSCNSKVIHRLIKKKSKVIHIPIYLYGKNEMLDCVLHMPVDLKEACLQFSFHKVS